MKHHQSTSAKHLEVAEEHLRQWFHEATQSFGKYGVIQGGAVKPLFLKMERYPRKCVGQVYIKY